MYKLAATRFNNKTWKENKDWREKNQHTGCLYSNPSKLKESIQYGTTIFILEMNNDKNKIMGIGLIKKQPIIGNCYRIYEDGNINRYTYKSQYRIDIEDLRGYNRAIVEMFDTLLFKTKRHIKRAHGITELPAWILNTKQINFIEFFRELFKEVFPQLNAEKIAP